MNKTAIIVGRTESARFPGKVLALLHGIPICVRQIQQYLKNGYKTIYATTTKPADDKLAEVVQLAGAELYRGHDRNVFMRVWDAIEKFNITGPLLEISGDCPFRMPDWADELYEVYGKYGDDFDEYNWGACLRDVGELATPLRTMNYYKVIYGLVNALPKHVIDETEGSYGAILTESINRRITRYNAGIPHGFIYTKTPPKLSIDYRAELYMWNAIFKQFGKFPDGPRELFEALENFKVQSNHELLEPQ